VEPGRRSRRRAVEGGEDPHERALARAARPEDDDELSLGDVERRPVGRDGRARGRRVDAEEVGGRDRGHSIPSENRQRATRSYACAVAASAASAATTAVTPSASATSRQSRTSSSDGRGAPAPAVTLTTETTRALTIAPAATPPASPTAATMPARSRRCRRRA